jgi:hypothetical protein
MSSSPFGVGSLRVACRDERPCVSTDEPYFAMPGVISPVGAYYIRPRFVIV